VTVLQHGDIAVRHWMKAAAMVKLAAAPADEHWCSGQMARNV
jgi:hypothetical protein